MHDTMNVKFFFGGGGQTIHVKADSKRNLGLLKGIIIIIIIIIKKVLLRINNSIL